MSLQNGFWPFLSDAQNISANLIFFLTKQKKTDMISNLYSIDVTPKWILTFFICWKQFLWWVSIKDLLENKKYFLSACQNVDTDKLKVAIFLFNLDLRFSFEFLHIAQFLKLWIPLPILIIKDWFIGQVRLVDSFYFKLIIFWSAEKNFTILAENKLTF